MTGLDHQNRWLNRQQVRAQPFRPERDGHFVFALAFALGISKSAGELLIASDPQHMDRVVSQRLGMRYGTYGTRV